MWCVVCLAIVSLWYVLCVCVLEPGHGWMYEKIPKQMFLFVFFVINMAKTTPKPFSQFSWWRQNHSFIHRPVRTARWSKCLSVCLKNSPSHLWTDTVNLCGCCYRDVCVFVCNMCVKSFFNALSCAPICMPIGLIPRLLQAPRCNCSSNWWSDNPISTGNVSRFPRPPPPQPSHPSGGPASKFFPLGTSQQTLKVPRGFPSSHRQAYSQYRNNYPHSLCILYVCVHGWNLCLFVCQLVFSAHVKYFKEEKTKSHLENEKCGKCLLNVLYKSSQNYQIHCQKYS